MNSSDLLTALDMAGSADSTIEAGRKFVRLMNEEDPVMLINHFRELRITEGTIMKAQELLSGRKKPEDYHGKPPQWSKESEHRQLAKMVGQEVSRVLIEQQTKQSEHQSEANAGNIGNPKRHREEIGAALKK